MNINYITSDMYGRIANNSKKSYMVEDCVMIRATDVFPKDGVIQTPKNGNAYDFGRSVIFEDAVVAKVKKLFSEPMSIEDEEEYLKKLKEYDLFFDIPRSTIHFTMNGLVSSHMYGNFDNKPFIIIEPLKYHINDKSLVGLRPEDTYFNDNITLSQESIIMIPKYSYEFNKNNVEYLEMLKKYKVIVFGGDEKEAVEYVIRSLGYNAFKVGQYGYTDSFMGDNDETRMTLYLRSLANEKGISQEKHVYSEVYQKDQMEMIKKAEKREREYLLYILDNIVVPENLKNQIIRELSNCRDISYMRYKESIFKVLDLIGLDNLKQLTLEYNKKCINEINRLTNNKVY